MNICFTTHFLEEYLIINDRGIDSFMFFSFEHASLPPENEAILVASGVTRAVDFQAVTDRPGLLLRLVTSKAVRLCMEIRTFALDHLWALAENLLANSTVDQEQ